LPKPSPTDRRPNFNGPSTPGSLVKFRFSRFPASHRWGDEGLVRIWPGSNTRGGDFITGRNSYSTAGDVRDYRNFWPGILGVPRHGVLSTWVCGHYLWENGCGKRGRLGSSSKTAVLVAGGGGRTFPADGGAVSNPPKNHPGASTPDSKGPYLKVRSFLAGGGHQLFLQCALKGRIFPKKGVERRGN